MWWVRVVMSMEYDVHGVKCCVCGMGCDVWCKVRREARCEVVLYYLRCEIRIECDSPRDV